MKKSCLNIGFVAEKALQIINSKQSYFSSEDYCLGESRLRETDVLFWNQDKANTRVSVHCIDALKSQKEILSYTHPLETKIS